MYQQKKTSKNPWFASLQVLAILLLLTMTLQDQGGAAAPAGGDANRHYKPIWYNEVLERLEKIVKEDGLNIFNLTYGETIYKDFPVVYCSDSTVTPKYFFSYKN